jgi:hypothetical protein
MGIVLLMEMVVGKLMGMWGRRIWMKKKSSAQNPWKE